MFSRRRLGVLLLQMVPRRMPPRPRLAVCLLALDSPYASSPSTRRMPPCSTAKVESLSRVRNRPIQALLEFCLLFLLGHKPRPSLKHPLFHLRLQLVAGVDEW